MSNTKFVRTSSTFAQLSKIKKLTSSQNLKSLTQKTKIHGNYPASRRFGNYSFCKETKQNTLANVSHLNNKISYILQVTKFKQYNSLDPKVQLLFCNLFEHSKQLLHKSRTLGSKELCYLNFVTCTCQERQTNNLLYFLLSLPAYN